MRIITRFSCGLDIQNPINLYTDEDNLMQILINQYQNRCLAGKYIVKITQIVRRGECIINQDGAPSFAVIPVVFDAEAIVFAVGEIITGCKVVNRDKQTGSLICTTDISSIIVAKHPAFESIVRGQYISVRVREARYNISADKVSISAVPYTTSADVQIFKINGPVTAAGRELMRDVLDRITNEEAEMAKLRKDNPKAWDTFDQLLYAYSASPFPPTGATLTDMRNVIKNTNGIAYICRDSKINQSTPGVYTYTSLPQGLDSNARLITNLDADTVMLHILESYAGHLRLIREMINIYGTEDMIKSHVNLWQIYRKMKV